MSSARSLAIALLVLSFPPALPAQDPELRLPSFEHLRGQAVDSVDITLSAWPLNLVAFMMDEDDPHDAEVKKVLGKLKAIRVRSYTFASDFEYPEADVEAVRRQLQQKGWSTLVQVRNRHERSAVDVCIALDGDRATGLAIVATEPKEFTIVNLVGSIEHDTLDKLQGRLGVPRLAGVPQPDLPSTDREH